MLNSGDVIDGKYQIMRLIGEGGMGAVYEGLNSRIHRRVAIKVLHAGVAQNAEAVQRFEREAQAAGRIGSEHIVEVLDLGSLPDGDRYMVMEFLEGESLSERIRSRGCLSAGELYPIAIQMLQALTAAHQAGIIHRDLKPDNVFLLHHRGGQADFVKLLDFGISKFSQLNKDSGFSMTRTGAVMGTPYYLAPEQAKGAKDIDRRADLYAAGVILYEACTGQVPFNADTFNELLFKIVLEQPRNPQELVPSLDPAFAAIILKGMAREPADRYSSAEEFRQALEQWASTAAPEVLAAPAGAVAGRPALGSFSGTRGGVPAATPTPGTWSQTGAGITAASSDKKRKPMLMAFAGVGALVLAAGGGVAWKMTQDAAEAAAAAEQRAAAELAEAQRQAAEAEAKLEAERAAAEKAKEEAERARLEAEKAAKDAASLKDRKAREEASKEAEEKARLAAEAEARAQQQRTRAAAAAAAVQAPPKKSTAPASTGRKIRTSL